MYQEQAPAGQPGQRGRRLALSLHTRGRNGAGSYRTMSHQWQFLYPAGPLTSLLQGKTNDSAALASWSRGAKRLNQTEQNEA